MWLSLASLILGAYLVGSVPVGLWIAKRRGIDLRSEGSGNIGATNVARVMGLRWGVGVFVLDLIKGLAPTVIAIIYLANPYWHIAVGLSAIIGQNFPIFAQFKGGKGAATGLGVLLAINPAVFLLTAVIAGTLIKITRTVSIGTLTACILVPLLLIVVGAPHAYVHCILIICLLIIWRHIPNIKRLLKGTENSF